MTKLTTLVFLGVFAVLAGCTEPDHYPISGQECGPDDPVLDLDANDCVLPI